MSNRKAKKAALGSTLRDVDRFTENLRKSLEHIADPEWLSEHSPLASVFFAGANVFSARQRQIVLTNRTDIDQRLRTIWHAWEHRDKIPLQCLLWEAVCRLPVNRETPHQAILLLTYFDDEDPKQREVIRRLAIGRSTYYRYLEKAIDQLSETITTILRPSLQLETPIARPLFGRTEEIAEAQAKLSRGQVVHLLGGSGLGKTALGAHLVNQWPHGVFWYTFRPCLTDDLAQLIFALAYFFHEQGESGLWLYVSSCTEQVDPARALLAIRHHLSELRNTPPLFCFDEVDLLLADDLDASSEHALLRSLLEEWSQTGRAGSPLLLIGQKLLLEPVSAGLIHLGPLTAPGLSELTAADNISLTAKQSEQVLWLTRGNPLLIRLFLIVCGRNASATAALEQLTHPINLDWFVIRVCRHLTRKEQVVLFELSVFPDSAPKDGWIRTQKQLETLIDLGLVEPLRNNSVSLHPALRKRFYEQLTPERRSELHLAAGHLQAERGRFTAAARHYVAGARPELAVWTWYTHREREIEQGQAHNALALFRRLDSSSLPSTEDRRALALLLAPLLARAGHSREALLQMEEIRWPEDTVQGVLAHEIRGELYAEVGEIERSLSEFRRSLGNMRNLRSTHEADLHMQIARRTLIFMGDREQAAQELKQATLTLQILRGNLERMGGNYDEAREHYAEALAVASESNSVHRLATLHESLGTLEALQGNLEAAISHYEEAGRFFQTAGNVVSAVGVTNAGLAYAYLLQRRYADAIAPAEKALVFFRELNHAYWIAISETYLAEAWFYLGDLEKAEKAARAGLDQEEIAVRPYCLFLLGHVRRSQKRFEEAQRYCEEAIDAANALQDPAALAPAWSALGETLRDAGYPNEAREALQQAVNLWQDVGTARDVTHATELLNDVQVPVSA